MMQQPLILSTVPAPDTDGAIDGALIQPLSASWPWLAGLLVIVAAGFILKGFTPRYGCLRRLAMTFTGILAVICFAIFLYVYITNIELPALTA